MIIVNINLDEKNTLFYQFKNANNDDCIYEFALNNCVLLPV